MRNFITESHLLVAVCVCVGVVIVEATFMLSAQHCIRSVPTPQMYLLSGTKMKKEEKNEKTCVRVVPFGGAWGGWKGKGIWA